MPRCFPTAVFVYRHVGTRWTSLPLYAGPRLCGGIAKPIRTASDYDTSRKLAVERDFGSGEEFFPASADKRMLGGNDIEQLPKRRRGNGCVVVRQDAAPASREPYLCGMSGRRSLAHVHVNRLTGFVRSEVDAVSTYEKQARQL